MPAPADAAAQPAVSAATAVVAAALLALAGAAGVTPSALVVVALGAALAVGWPVLLALPSPRGTMAVIGASGISGALVVATGATAAEGPSLRRVPVVLALAVLAASAHQLLRRDLRPRVVDSLGGTLLGAALAGCAAAWVALPASPGGVSLTVVSAAAAGSACLLLLLPIAGRLRAAAVLFGAVAVGAFVAAATPTVPVGAGAVLGAVLGAVVVAMDHLLARLPAAGRKRSRVALVVAPLTASGLAAHVVGHLLLA